MNDFVGNILQNKFYAHCYILLPGTRPKIDAPFPTALLLHVQLVLKPRCCQLHTALNSPHPIHAADGHYIRNSSCITLLWLCHNHKMSIRCHKNGLVSSHRSVGRWLIFMCFVVRIFWRNLLAINSLLVSVSRCNWWLEVQPFRFHVNCIHFRRAGFVHVRSAQLCTENGVSFYMCSAVEIAWLAQNNRHSDTCVWLHLQWRLGVSNE